MSRKDLLQESVFTPNTQLTCRCMVVMHWVSGMRTSGVKDAQ